MRKLLISLLFLMCSGVSYAEKTIVTETFNYNFVGLGIPVLEVGYDSKTKAKVGAGIIGLLLTEGKVFGLGLDAEMGFLKHSYGLALTFGGVVKDVYIAPATLKYSRHYKNSKKTEADGHSISLGFNFFKQFAGYVGHQTGEACGPFLGISYFIY